MSTPYSYTPRHPPAPHTTPISAAHPDLGRRAATRAPILNPYDKFSQNDFDSWIGGITGALRHALGQTEEPQQEEVEKKAPVEQPLSRDIEYKDLGMETELEDDYVEDSFADIKLRRAVKGKGRDPLEGPGLSGGWEKDAPIEILSDSEEEDQEEEEEEQELESEGAAGESDEEGWEEEQTTTYLRRAPISQAHVEDEDDDEGYEDEELEAEETLETQQDRVHAYPSGQLEYSDEEGSLEESPSLKPVDAFSPPQAQIKGHYESDEEYGSEDSAEHPSPRAQHSPEIITLDSDEEEDGEVPQAPLDRHEILHSDEKEYLEPGSSPLVGNDQEFEGSDRASSPLVGEDQKFEDSDRGSSPVHEEEDEVMYIEDSDEEAQGSSLQRPVDEEEDMFENDELEDEDEDDVQPLEEDTSFPPRTLDTNDVQNQDAEIRDPWSGARTYAEDFYSGGDGPLVRGHALDPHVIEDSEDSDHESSTKEADAADAAFVPERPVSDTGSTPVEIRDPWVGPETYAQDYYSGGDLNRALEEELDPHLLGPEQTQRLSEEVGVFDVDSVSGIEVPPSTAPTDHFSDPEPAPRLFPFSATVTGEATRHDAPRDQPEEGEATKPYEAQAHEEIVEVSDASDDVSTGLSGAPEAEEQQERVYTPQADIVNVTQPEVPAPSPTFDGSVDPEVETASRPDDDILTIPGLGEPVSSSYEIEELDDDDFNLLYPDPTPQPSLGRITPEEDKPSLNNSEASSEVTARAPQPSDLATEDSRAQDIVPARKASPEIIMVEDSSDEEGDSEEFDQAQDEEMSGDVDRILVPEEVVEDQDVQTSVEVVDVESRKEEAIEEEDEAMIEARPEHKEDVMETGDVSEDAAGHNEVESEASSQGPVVEATPEVPEPVEQGPADLDSPSETAEEQSTLQEDTSHAEEEGQTIYTEHHKIEIEEVTDEDADEPLHPHPESDELPNESFAVDGNLSEPAKVVAAEELDVTETTCIVTEPVFEGMAMDDEDADGEMDDDFEVISVGSASSLQADNVGTVEEVDELEVQGLGETVKSTMASETEAVAQPTPGTTAEEVSVFEEQIAPPQTTELPTEKPHGFSESLAGERELFTGKDEQPPASFEASTPSQATDAKLDDPASGAEQPAASVDVAEQEKPVSMSREDLAASHRDDRVDEPTAAEEDEGKEFAQMLSTDAKIVCTAEDAKPVHDAAPAQVEEASISGVPEVQLPSSPKVVEQTALPNTITSNPTSQDLGTVEVVQGSPRPLEDYPASLSKPQHDVPQLVIIQSGDMAPPVEQELGQRYLDEGSTEAPTGAATAVEGSLQVDKQTTAALAQTNTAETLVEDGSEASAAHVLGPSSTADTIVAQPSGTESVFLATQPVQPRSPTIKIPPRATVRSPVQAKEKDTPGKRKRNTTSPKKAASPTKKTAKKAGETSAQEKRPRKKSVKGKEKAVLDDEQDDGGEIAFKPRKKLKLQHSTLASLETSSKPVSMASDHSGSSEASAARLLQPHSRTPSISGMSAQTHPSPTTYKPAHLAPGQPPWMPHIAVAHLQNPMNQPFLHAHGQKKKELLQNRVHIPPPRPIPPVAPPAPSETNTRQTPKSVEVPTDSSVPPSSPAVSNPPIASSSQAGSPRTPVAEGSNGQASQGPTPLTARTSRRAKSLRAIPSNSPRTRSHCTFHKISFPDANDTRVHFFLVPGCSLTRQNVIEDGAVQDHGDATYEDSMRCVGDVDTIKGIERYAIAVLTNLVGVEIMREREIYYLPEENEVIERKVVEHVQGHSRRTGSVATVSGVGKQKDVSGILSSSSDEDSDGNPNDSDYDEKKDSAPPDDALESVSTKKSHKKSKSTKLAAKRTGSTATRQRGQAKRSRASAAHDEDAGAEGPDAKKAKVDVAVSQPSA